VLTNGIGVVNDPIQIPGTKNCWSYATLPIPRYTANTQSVDPLLLKFCLINARSVKNKLEELHYLLAECDYDVIFMVETWLNDTVTNPMLVKNLPYEVYRRDRGSVGGGLAVFVKTSLCCNFIAQAENTEAICLDMGPGVACIIVGYLPDSNNIDNILKMNNFIVSNFSPKLPNIIVGDFNMSLINWANSKCNCNNQQIFFDCVNDLGFTQLVTEPTRGNRILDLVFTDDDQLVFDIDVVEHFSSSDHNMVTFSIQVLLGARLENKSAPCKKYVNYNTLHGILKTIDWSSGFRDDMDAESLWVVFHNRLSEIVNLCTSFKRYPKSKRVLPLAIRKLHSKKLKLWRKYKSTRDLASKSRYSECSKLLTKELKRHEMETETKVIKDGSVSALFRYIKNKTNSVRTIPPLHVHDRLIFLMKRF